MTTRTILLLAALSGLAMAGEQPAKMNDPFVLSAPAEHKPQYYAQIAWSTGAKAWLVVWQDGAPTDDGTDGEGPAQNILAVRVSADGKVLDAKPIEVSTAKGAQMRPRVASDGKDWLVVWHDFRNGKDWDLYAARVTGDGKALEEDGVLLVGGGHNQCFADIVFGGGNYYMAWLDMRHWPEYRVYGSRVSAGGKVLDGRDVELMRTMSDKNMDAWRKAPFARYGGKVRLPQPGPPSLGTDGRVHVVVSEIAGQTYRTSPAITLRAVDAVDGRPKGERHEIADSGRTNMPYLHWCRMSVAKTGDGFLIGNHLATGSWGSGPGSWMTVRLSADGTPFGSKPDQFQEVFTLDSKFPPGYRSYGNRHVVLDLAWGKGRGLFVSENHEHKKAVSPGNIDVLALFIDAKGKRLGNAAPLKIAAGAATQAAPCAAAGPEGVFLVAWQEEEPGKDSRIMARTVRTK